LGITLVAKSSSGFALLRKRSQGDTQPLPPTPEAALQGKRGPWSRGCRHPQPALSPQPTVACGGAVGWGFGRASAGRQSRL